MTISETRTGAVVASGRPIQWKAIIAGAVAAAALAFVLHAFAAAIGISASSAAPTWRDASMALVLLSGLYLLLAAAASYAFGGYIAARAESRLSARADVDEWNDGMHGLLTWALATLLTAVFALAAAQMAPRLAAPSGSPSVSVAGENIIAFDLDRLFRTEKKPDTDMNYIRAEASRILLTASSRSGLQQDDRAYLIRLVAANTGASAGDAEKRVDTATAAAKENIARARRSATILAFMAAAAALIGAAAAWFAAIAGARHRDGLDAVPEFLDWNKPYRHTW